MTCRIQSRLVSERPKMSTPLARRLSRAFWNARNSFAELMPFILMTYRWHRDAAFPKQWVSERGIRTLLEESEVFLSKFGPCLWWVRVVGGGYGCFGCFGEEDSSRFGEQRILGDDFGVSVS